MSGEGASKRWVPTRCVSTILLSVISMLRQTFLAWQMLMPLPNVVMIQIIASSNMDIPEDLV